MELFQSIMNCSDEPIALVKYRDESFYLYDYNPAFEDMTGSVALYRGETLITECFKGADSSRIYSKLIKCLCGCSDSFEIRTHFTGSNKQYLTKIHAHSALNKQYFSLHFTDLTPHRIESEILLTYYNDIENILRNTIYGNALIEINPGGIITRVRVNAEFKRMMALYYSNTNFRFIDNESVKKVVLSGLRKTFDLVMRGKDDEEIEFTINSAPITLWDKRSPQKVLITCIENSKRIILAADKLSLLSKREKEVALMALLSYSNAQISDFLGIEVDTVKKTLSSIYRKLNIYSRGELAKTINR